MEFLAIVSVGIGIFSTLVKLIAPIFSKTTPATTEQTTVAIGTALDTTVGAMTAISKGPQAELWAEAAKILPEFKDLLTAAILFVEKKKPATGAEKQALVTTIMNDALVGWQDASKGPQATTATELVPVIHEVINTLVPIIIPKDNPTGISAETTNQI